MMIGYTVPEIRRLIAHCSSAFTSPNTTSGSGRTGADDANTKPASVTTEDAATHSTNCRCSTKPRWPLRPRLSIRRVLAPSRYHVATTRVRVPRRGCTTNGVSGLIRGFRSGGMGTVSNDRRDRESTEEARRRRTDVVPGAGGSGDDRRGQGARAGTDRPDGLLKLFTKNVLETALNEEMTEHIGHEKNQADQDRGSTNVRNGARSKTVVSDAVGEVKIEVPRDREGTFEPQIVKKRQRRLTEIDEIVLSLYAKALTTGEISAHFADIYGASISKETVSRITDKVLAEMAEWSSRPLDPVYVAVFIDAIVVKVRCETVRSRTDRCTQPSGSPWTAVRTSWGCGRASAGRARSSG
jgi:hypothetical protein